MGLGAGKLTQLYKQEGLWSVSRLDQSQPQEDGDQICPVRLAELVNSWALRDLF